MGERISAPELPFRESRAPDEEWDGLFEPVDVSTCLNEPDEFLRRDARCLQRKMEKNVRLLRGVERKVESGLEPVRICFRVVCSRKDQDLSRVEIPVLRKYKLPNPACTDEMMNFESRQLNLERRSTRQFSVPQELLFHSSGLSCGFRNLSRRCDHGRSRLSAASFKFRTLDLGDDSSSPLSTMDEFRACFNEDCIAQMHVESMRNGSWQECERTDIFK